MDRHGASNKSGSMSAEQFAELMSRAGRAGGTGAAGHELRLHPRLMHRGKVILAPGAVGGPADGRLAVLRDVSMGGIGLLNAFALPRDATVRLKLPGGGSLLELLYTVTNCVQVERSLFRMGAQLICVAPRAEAELDEEAVRRVRAAILG